MALVRFISGINIVEIFPSYYRLFLVPSKLRWSIVFFPLLKPDP